MIRKPSLTFSLLTFLASLPNLIEALPFTGGTGDVTRQQQLPFSLSTSSPSTSHLDESWRIHQGKELVRIEKGISTDEMEIENLVEYLESQNYDIWLKTRSTIDVFLPSSHSPHLLTKLPSNTTTTTLLNPSTLTTLLQTPHPPAKNLFEDPTRSLHKTYHPYDSITSLVHLFAGDYPDLAEVVEMGRSSEGRIVWGLRVGKRLNQERDRDRNQDWGVWDGGEGGEDVVGTRRRKGRKGRKEGEEGERRDEKMEFLVLGGQHAREWIAPATILFLAHSFLLSASSSPSSIHYDKRISDFMEEFTFVFVPVVNVDGYVYSWEHDRLWKKNRQVVGGDDGDGDVRCKGIDLNRNWDAHFILASPTTDRCSESYQGTEPFQAPELRALRDYVTDGGNNVVGWLDFHAYGQLLMYPYSFSCSTTPADEENLMEAALGASKALRGVHGRVYDTGSVCWVSYTASGESIDWAYKSAGIKWSFATELRDTGTYGFLLPPEQIIPTGEENLEMLISLTDFVSKHHHN